MSPWVSVSRDLGNCHTFAGLQFLFCVGFFTRANHLQRFLCSWTASPIRSSICPSSIHPPALEWHRVLIKSMVSWAPFLLALAMDVKPAAFPAAAVLVNEATLGWEPYVNKGWGRRQEEPGSLTTERWIAYLRLNLGDRKWISFLSNHLDFLLCK